MDCQTRTEAMQRLRSIEGHIRAIERMLDDGHACVDVVRQTLAAKRALEGASRLLVAGHLQACVRMDPGSERVVQDLLDVLQLSVRL